MILVDTDHLSVILDPRHRLSQPLLEQLDEADQPVSIPVIAVEEQLRAWLAQIRRARDAHAQIVPYSRLVKLIDFLAGWAVADWAEPAAEIFQQLRHARIRIGTQDLKIASIALAENALLLSANLRDLEQVPNLRVEDWLNR